MAEDPPSLDLNAASIKDLSEVEALRKELRVEKGKTAAIVEAISEPMLIFNDRAEVEWHNAQAEFVFGRRKVIHGTPCHLLMCDRHEPCEECPVAQFAKPSHNPGAVRTRRTMRTTDGGNTPFELTMRRMPSMGQPAHSLVLFRDVAQEAGSEQAILERLHRGSLHLEVSDVLLSSREPTEMLGRFADLVAGALDLSSVAVLLRRAEDWLEPVAVYHGGAGVVGVPHRIPAGNTGIREVVSTGKSRLVRDTDKSAAASGLVAVLERDGAPSSNSLLIAPLTSRSGAVSGVLVAGRPEVDAFETEDVELWEGIAARLGLALDGVMQMEANQRVVKLQQALIAEADVLMRPMDWTKNASRFLEVLCEATGAPSSGLVYRSSKRDQVRLFLSYTQAIDEFAGPSRAVARSKSPILSRPGVADEVTAVDLRTLLKQEREDPVLRTLITEDSETLVLVPAGIKDKIDGWIAVTLPSGFRISTPSEFDVLRNLGQQSQLALGTLLAAGKLDEMRRALEGA